ncbi:MAG: HipA domain-containing protein [Clostridia bacterium]
MNQTGSTALIDFTDCPVLKDSYDGANGCKLGIRYNSEVYMLKFAAHATRNSNLHYSNSCISEYIGSHIFSLLGIPAQETLLGTYKVPTSESVTVVACKDFTQDGTILQSFTSVKNRMIISKPKKSATDLDDVLKCITQQPLVDLETVLCRFWDMFIIDAFIGNWDRHNGNWGFLYNRKTDTCTLAPVFDCGSSLYPQADETLIQKILSDQSEIDFRVYKVPLSAFTQESHKINYFEYISSLNNEGCNRALARIVPLINMKDIKQLINSVSGVTQLQKTFYIQMLEERKQKILDYSLHKLREPTAGRTSYF